MTESEGSPSPAGNAQTMTLLRIGKTIRLQLREKGASAPNATYFIHEAEARKLATRLTEVLDGGDGSRSLVEGIYTDAPPIHGET